MSPRPRRAPREMLVGMTPLDRALGLLARKARTEREMELALEKAGVSAGERAEAVARLRELGYMDDLEVARTRARTLLGRGAAPRLAGGRLGGEGGGGAAGGAGGG